MVQWVDTEWLDLDCAQAVEDDPSMLEPKASDQELNLDTVLKHFSQPELLKDSETWYCPDCKEHREATKTLEIWSRPDVLGIHLKRFHHSGEGYRDKLENEVAFPIEELDLTPYLSGPDSENPESNHYRLIGVLNHMGGLGGGHYTATCLNHSDGLWYSFNDSYVRAESKSSIVCPEAYCLIYQRKGTGEDEERAEAIATPDPPSRPKSPPASTVDTFECDEGGDYGEPLPPKMITTTPVEAFSVSDDEDPNPMSHVSM
eukprot:m.284199 g.284199  ORF g.284199 m.284199 type:complete len:259 (-) comp19422_c2_seq12:268-1044(-)